MIRNCDNCGKIYDADIRNVNRGWGLCCSKSCAASKREKSKPNYSPERVLDEKLQVELTEGVHYNDWADESSVGYEVDLLRLPKGVTKLRFYNNW